VSPTCVSLMTLLLAYGRALVAFEKRRCRIPAHRATRPTCGSDQHLIGPEGGLAAEEVETAIGAGWQVVGMGRVFPLGQRTPLYRTAAFGQLGGDAPSVKLPPVTSGHAGDGRSHVNVAREKDHLEAKNGQTE